MTLEWQSDFETGNQAVDLQHRYFVDLINRMEDNYHKSDNTAYCRKLIMELKKYAEFHFISEENIATALKLPGVRGHHERHLELLAEFDRYADKIDHEQKAIDAFLRFLTEWFAGHTFHEDQKLFQKSNFK